MDFLQVEKVLFPAHNELQFSLIYTRYIKIMFVFPSIKPRFANFADLSSYPCNDVAFGSVVTVVFLVVCLDFRHFFGY